MQSGWTIGLIKRHILSLFWLDKYGYQTHILVVKNINKMKWKKIIIIIIEGNELKVSKTKLIKYLRKKK